MAKTPKTVSIREAPPKPHGLIPSDVVQKSLGIDDAGVATRKISEISSLLWKPENGSEDDHHVQLLRALELYESLDPTGGADGMLATQMVGTHFAALECLRRASLSNQTFEGRDVNLKHAQKLMALYGKQLETLNKHRGKGQQKVTVEHVHVAPGGQAIVGNVETQTRDHELTAQTRLPQSTESPLRDLGDPKIDQVARKGKTP